MYKLIALVLGATFIVTSPAEGKFRKCRVSESYQPPAQADEKGTCVKCPPCPLAQERDGKAPRNRSKEFGFLECYSCKPCEDNYYRDTAVLSTCSVCRKDCESGHRFVGVKCGGSSPGTCGDCFPGYEPSDRHNNESFCLPVKEKVRLEAPVGEGSTSEVDVRGVESDNINLDVNNFNSVDVDLHQHALQGNTLVVVAAIFVVLAVCLVCLGYLILKRRRTRQVPPTLENLASSVRLLQSTSSGGSQSFLPNQTFGPIPVSPRGEQPVVLDITSLEQSQKDNQTCGHETPDGAESCLPTEPLRNTGSRMEDQIETDGPIPVPRRELSSDVTSHVSPPQRTSPIDDGMALLQQRDDPSGHSGRLTQNSRELDLVARNIYGENKVLELFRCLGIDKASKRTIIMKWHCIQLAPSTRS